MPRWNGPIHKISDYRYEIPDTYQSEAMKRAGLKMKVPGLIFTDDIMLESILADASPDQVAHVATLPGIVGRSFAMPDIHHGYGFAIGGVAAFDASSGVISPGGVGYDINCGVRLIRSNLLFDEVKPNIKAVVDKLFENVPSGVGAEGRVKLNKQEIDWVLTQGAQWAHRNGYAWNEDSTFMEDNGGIAGANPEKVSVNAKARGAPQLGSLGAGNHFLEIQRVEEIFDTPTAEAFGITEIRQITIMIHCGSRGCGHQICTDYLDVMRRANQKYNIPLVDKELTSAPADSPEAEDYFGAMRCAANYAWANRQLITHWIRESFESVLGKRADQLGLHIIYDIAHNMAKLEQHEYDGKKRLVYVHRKGATRAFGPGNSHLPEKYRAVGQPVIIPGDMGSASYLLVGTEAAMKETFGSSCHGAGRKLSRTAATKQFQPNEVVKKLDDYGVYIRAASKRGISEEAPGAYKNIDDVIQISHNSGIAKKVARLRPIGVVKG